MGEDGLAGASVSLAAAKDAAPRSVEHTREQPLRPTLMMMAKDCRGIFQMASLSIHCGKRKGETSIPIPLLDSMRWPV